MADKFLNLSGVRRLWEKIQNYIDTKVATETKYGQIKLNPSKSISLNSSGQLEVGGRLGQFSTTTGVYNPNTIDPGLVGDGSLLLTEASGTKLGNKSLGVTTGAGLSLKTQAAAGATEYVVSNTYENRIICAALVGGTLALNEATAKENYADVVSVTINGSSFVPDSSPNSTTNNIIIKTSKSINPNSATSSVRPYANSDGGFSNLLVGQLSGGKGGASVVVGQKVFSVSGNASAVVGASIYNSGNGNALFGRQHISRKNRSFLAGTGHDTTNAKNESVAAIGEWSLITSDTAFAIGNGTNATTRKNLFEVKTNGDVYINGTKVLP